MRLTYHCFVSYLPTLQSMENSACNSEYCSAVCACQVSLHFEAQALPTIPRKLTSPTIRLPHEIPPCKTQSKECIQMVVRRAGEIVFSTGLAPVTRHSTPSPRTTLPGNWGGTVRKTKGAAGIAGVQEVCPSFPYIRFTWRLYTRLQKETLLRYASCILTVLSCCHVAPSPVLLKKTGESFKRRRAPELRAFALRQEILSPPPCVPRNLPVITVFPGSHGLRDVRPWPRSQISLQIRAQHQLPQLTKFPWVSWTEVSAHVCTSAHRKRKVMRLSLVCGERKLS